MPHPNLPLRPPDLPHCIRYWAQQTPRSFPPRLQFVLQRLHLGVPKPHPIPNSECPSDPSAPGTVISLHPLLASMLMQPPPHRWRAGPQLVWRTKDKRAPSLPTFLWRRDGSVIVDIHGALNHSCKILGAFRPHPSKTVQKGLVKTLYKSDGGVMIGRRVLLLHTSLNTPPPQLL